jgi:nonsense-mediated mRNA decay protein 3
MMASTSALTPAAPVYASILCCECGILMQTPNSINTCATCLASSADITRGISTEATLHQCRGCQRWHKDASKWVSCELESRELMALCLEHISGLKRRGVGQDIRLVDAAWVWTEPHSMRLKVRLTVQRQVQGTILQQSFVVVFIVRNQQCIECQSAFRQGSWKALVQVRQRVSHKRTFLYLEQLILKNDAHRGCINVETFRDGMDFYFPDKGKAARFISFLESVCPIKLKTSKKLISTDDKNNTANYKFTNFVEICPLCKDDLLFLPAKLARNLGNITRLVTVKNISNLIHLIDPLTGQTASMSSEQFWREPLVPIITAARSRMTRYVVLGKEAMLVRENASKRKTSRKQRTRLASLALAREDDLGVNDTQFDNVHSHVGYLCKSGDVCLGYDLTETQFVDDVAEVMRNEGKLPDVIVVRKLYGAAASGEENAAKQRMWKLKRLDVEQADEGNGGKKKSKQPTEDMDEEDFMQEIEADKEMRLNMNLYKSEKAAKTVDEGMDAGENDDDDDEDDQQIKLEELLDALALDQGPDAQEDADMLPEDGETTYVEGEHAAKAGISYIAREDARIVRDRDVAVVATEFKDDISL